MIPGEKREGEGEEEDTPVDAQIEEQRNIGRQFDRCDGVIRPTREEQTDGAAQDGKHDTFG